MGAFHSSPLWGEVGRGAFSAFCLSCLLVLREGVGSRPDSRVPFCARPGGEPQKGSFTLAWGGTHIAKQCEWRPKSASATLSGETHFAPASLRSNSRRKFEFLYGSTPVLQLACGVAQALRLELPLPLAGEGGGEGACVSFPCWGKAGMGASLLLVEAVCLLSGRGSGLGPTADPISFASPKEMGERKGEPCRRLVRRNSLRSCVAPFRQPPEI